MINRINRTINLWYVSVIVALLTFARQPSFFVSPRLWAEEGTVFLSSALENGGIASFLHQHLGYYSLFTKLSILAGTSLFPLEYLAFITTSLSAVLQLCTSLVIFSSLGRLGESKLLRLLFSLLPIILSTPEHWLNTINCQFWLATGTFFILNSRKINRFHLTYLAFAFMTGVSSLFFFPYFILRLFKEKDPSLRAVATIGIISLAIQFISLILFLQAGSGGRFQPEFAGNFLVGIAVTLMPYSKALSFLLFFPVALIAAFYYGRELVRNGDSVGLLYTYFSLASYTLLAVFSSLGMSGGSRYALPVYCGIAAIVLHALTQTAIPNNKLISFGRLAAIFLLSLKLINFTSTESVYSTDWPIWQRQLQSRSCEKPTEVLLFPGGDESNWKMTIPAHTGVECS